MPVILTLGRQEDCHELEASLGYRMRVHLEKPRQKGIEELETGLRGESTFHTNLGTRVQIPT